jgi:hypothetical protein
MVSTQEVINEEEDSIEYNAQTIDENSVGEEDIDEYDAESIDEDNDDKEDSDEEDTQLRGMETNCPGY